MTVMISLISGPKLRDSANFIALESAAGTITLTENDFSDSFWDVIWSKMPQFAQCEMVR